MAATADRSKPYIPLASSANDGWSKETSATATCFCGAVQLSFPTEGPGLVGTFVCHCTDCRKITASMFASNFTVDDTYLTHIRGRDNLTTAYNCLGQDDDKLFLLDLRYAHVSCWRGVSGQEYTAHWHGG